MQSPDLKTNLWIDEQIMAKEEVVVEEGVDVQTRTQVPTREGSTMKSSKEVHKEALILAIENYRSLNLPNPLRLLSVCFNAAKASKFS